VSKDNWGHAISLSRSLNKNTKEINGIREFVTRLLKQCYVEFWFVPLSGKKRLVYRKPVESVTDDERGIRANSSVVIHEPCVWVYAELRGPRPSSDRRRGTMLFSRYVPKTDELQLFEAGYTAGCSFHVT
jgi:hypothetical protein